MVLTRSQVLKDSPCKVPIRPERKKRRKNDDESSSDDEGKPEIGDVLMSSAVNLETIAEESEEINGTDTLPKVRLRNVYPNLNIKSLQITPNLDSTIKHEKTLAPILEESDNDALESEVDEGTQENVEKNERMELLTSSSISESSSKTENKSLQKHRFYFPPAKSLMPPTITPTSIDVGMEINDTYIDVKCARTGKKKINDLYSISTINSRELQLKDSIITSDFEAKHAIPAQKSLKQLRKDRKTERESTAGNQWFNFKPPEMTDEIKRDLEILKMRSILDPKRFYKHNDRKTLPKYFQVGRIVDDPTDFYSSRVPKKQRKANLTEELLADAEFKKYQKRKYNEIQIRNKARGAKRRRVKHGKFSKRKRESLS